MAQTPEEFRDKERRKMRIQADLNARRNSLMNLVAPRGVYAEEGPGVTLPAPPHPTVSSNVVEPRISAPLPGRDIVDANNSAAINLARQNPGVNLTDELNRRAAAQTGLDRMNIGFGGVVPESDTAVVQDLYRQNAIDATAAHPTPAHQTQTPVTADNPIAHWPDPMSIRDAGVDYGPGGTTPLTGITRIGSRQVAFPSDERLQSSSTQLTNAVRKIKKRAAIIRGTAALVGGDQKAADRYEAKALASLGVYAGQYAMSQLTDKDFKDKQTLMQSLIEKNMPLDQILKVLDSGVVESANEKKFVNWTDGTKTISLREGQQAPPGYWVGKLEGGSKGNPMRFIDEEGVGHLGYVQHDANGIPRYYLMDGSPVPPGWDMASPTASKITNNLSLQGEKMGEARQIAMAKMSRKWSNDAAGYFFDSSGRFKADRLDIIKATLDVPGEGRLAWTQMKNALAAALRLESGAAIGKEEAANYKARFFPKATDTEKTIIWKLRAFNDYVRALETINNPQWVYENLPHPIWNPKKVRTEKERDALPHGSYFTTPNGNLGRYVPNQTEAEVLLQ